MSRKDDRRSLRDDERELWTVFSKQIKPLSKPPAAKPDEPAAAPAVRLRKTAAPPGFTPPVPAANKGPPPLSPLGRREKAKVARGRAGIDGRLDLHGHTQAEAHGELLRFLRKAGDDEKRLVLVITGKSGVLRRQVPLWLALPEFRALVIGYEEAATRHGGEGALYVRVRRAR